MMVEDAVVAAAVGFFIGVAMGAAMVIEGVRRLAISQFKRKGAPPSPAKVRRDRMYDITEWP